MKIQFGKVSFFFAFLFIISNISWLGLAYSRKTFPYEEFKKIVYKSKRFMEIQKLGEKEFVQKTLASQVANSSSLSPKPKTIQTSVLPITKKYFSLVDSCFAKAGGALATVEGKILILGRLGRIYIFDGNKLKSLSFQVPNNLEKYILEYEGEAVLHSDALRAHSLTYDKIRSRIIASFTRFEEGITTRLVVATIQINKIDLTPEGSWISLFESEPIKNKATVSQSGGGKILIKENDLFLSIGYNEEKVVNGRLYASALDTESQFGKIIKIDLANDKIETYSTGHRNVQGMSIFNNKDVVATEHGPQGGDEINLLKKGNNYGWPLRTYGTRYGTYDYSFGNIVEDNFSDFSEPFFAFVPSIGISSILQLKNFNERWDGDLLVGSLKAQTLYRIKQVDNRVIFQEPIWIGHRIRDAIQLNKEIFLLTDDAKLISLSVDELALAKNVKGDNLIAKHKSMAKCITCHQFVESTPASLAPSLSNIYDRKIGSGTFERYSDAIKAYDGIWNVENLKQYIKDPSTLIPGTSMPSLGLNDDEIDEIINLLRKQ